MSHCDPHIPRSEYPRPDFDRSSRSPECWLSLNGAWSFTFDDEDKGVALHWPQLGVASWPVNALKTITVPFAYASTPAEHQHKPEQGIMWYSKEVPWDINLDSADGSDLLLKFASVSGEECTVWVNGIQVGHRGGGPAGHAYLHEPFEVDITQAVKRTTQFGSNFTVIVRVRAVNIDKDASHRGINGVVWLEREPTTRIQRGHIEADLDAGTFSLHVDVKPSASADPNAKVQQVLRVTAVVSLGGREITTDTVDVKHGAGDLLLKLATGVKTDFSPCELVHLQEPLPEGLFTPEQLNAAVQQDGIALWDPEHPVVYDVELDLVLVDTSTSTNATNERLLDRVKTHAAMRKAHVENHVFHLNNKPCVQRLAPAPDQAGWTNAPDEAAIISEIVAMEKKGFNGIRKHRKNQDPIWLYWADRLGLLVCTQDGSTESDYVDVFICPYVETVD